MIIASLLRISMFEAFVGVFVFFRRVHLRRRKTISDAFYSVLNVWSPLTPGRGNAVFLSYFRNSFLYLKKQFQRYEKASLRTLIVFFAQESIALLWDWFWSIALIFGWSELTHKITPNVTIQNTSTPAN